MIKTFYNWTTKEPAGTLDTDDFIFINSVEQGEFLVSVERYPYIKVNGEYYQTPGAGFSITTPDPNNALLMRSSSAFLYNDQDYRVVGFSESGNNVSKEELGKESNYFINTKTSDYLESAGVKNFGICDKEVRGIKPLQKKDTQDNSLSFTYPYPHNDQESPFFWDFVSSNPFICYSNFESVEDYWGNPQETTVNQYSEVLYYEGRRGIYKTFDETSQWWDNSKIRYNSYSLIVQDGNTSTGTTTYAGQTKIVKINQPKSNTLKLHLDPHTNTLTITRNGVTNTYCTEHRKQVVIATRALIDLQEEVRRQKALRFMMLYSTKQTGPYSVHVIATDSVPENASNLFFHTGATANKGGIYQEYSTFSLLKQNSNGSFGNNTQSNTTPLTWGDMKFVAGSSFVDVEVTLPDIQYYNITSLLELGDLEFPRDFSLLWDNMLVTIDNRFERKIDQTYSFVFDPYVYSTQHGLSVYSYGTVTYRLTLNNIRTFKPLPNYRPSNKPVTNVYQANLEHIVTNTGGSEISTSVILQKYFDWKIPNWFSNTFVNLSHDTMYISSYSEGTNKINLFYSAWEYESVAVPLGSGATGLKTVVGWKTWMTDYEHLIPSPTAIISESNTDFKTWWAAVVKYISGFQYPNLDTGYKGAQLGLTMGIAVNNDDVNTVDPVYHTSSNNNNQCVAILLCVA